MKTYNVPILFVFFNREDVAVKAFGKICNVRPSKLYLAQDGPRVGRGIEEKKNIERIRERLLGMIDWQCDVHTLFREENLGCSLGVKTAIDWLFEHEEKGIIMEDDCVAQESFFPFIQEMLERYQSDERIGMVDGANYIKSYDMPCSYCFSRFKSTNGWATWKRSWKNIDMQMSWIGTPYERDVLRNMGGNGRDIRYWKYRIKAIHHNFVSAWDWQWYFTLASQNQLSIFPKVGLITNIGFGDDATHTSVLNKSEQYKTSGNLTFPLVHPPYVMPDTTFDNAFYHNNNTLYNKIIQVIPFGLKAWLKNKFFLKK